MVTNSKEYNKKNYKKYWWTQKEIDRRAARNKANRTLKPWPWKEVDHKDWNPLNNSRSNLRVISRTTNRRLGARKANGK